MTIVYKYKNKETFAIINQQNVNITADSYQIFDNLSEEKENLLLSTGKFERVKKVVEEEKPRKIKRNEEVNDNDNINRV